MKKSEWLKLFLFFSVIIFFDQLSKNFAPDFSGKNAGWIHFSLHQNQGLVLGFFSDHSAFFRTIVISTFGLLLFGLYVFVQFQIQSKILFFRYGLAAVMAGILGNVIDRIQFGYVVDFLYLDILDYKSPVLNIADVFQCLGFGLILLSIFRYENHLIPTFSLKKLNWLNKSFEIRLATFLSIFGMTICAVSCVFSYLFFKFEISDSPHLNRILIDDKLGFFVETSVLLTIIFGALLYILGLLVAKKISGPLFAFERYVNRVIDDQPTSGRSVFRLRSSDELQNLEFLGNKVRLRINQKHIKKICSDLYFKE